MQDREGEAKGALAAAFRRRADRRAPPAPAGAMWKRAERLDRAAAGPLDRPADRAAAAKGERPVQLERAAEQEVAQVAMVAEPEAERAAMAESPMRTFRSGS